MSDEEQAPPGRSFWSGIISIGLVNVPVKLYTMIRDQSYSFHFLRKRDGCPLKYQRICTYDNEVVEWGDVARGYEVQRGEYVTFTKEELDAIRPESDRRIKIDKFIHYLSVDPLYFQNSYVLGPDKNGDAYGLLNSVLEKRGMAGVGRYTMRTKEYPVLIHSYRGALILTTLRYPNEVIDPGTVKDIKELKQPSNKELELADKILDNLTGEFDINEYKDTYRENVEKLIKKKLKGETIKVEKPEKKEEVKELMVALEQTLQQMKKG
ncbi:MAG: Ku protein [Candidatus Bathyarchaeota archaeon]|nr:Ku protein [Candidatus Bathyarchaeota archaeon]